MSPAEHYARAEQILEAIGELHPSPVIDPAKASAREAIRANRIALAQVHATLASTNTTTASA